MGAERRVEDFVSLELVQSNMITWQKVRAMLPFWPAGFIPPPIIEILMIYFFQYGSFGGGVYRDHLVGQLKLWPSRVGVQSNSRHSRPMLWEVLMMQFFNKRKAKNKKADVSTNLWEVGIVDLVTRGKGKTIILQQKNKNETFQAYWSTWKLDERQAFARESCNESFAFSKLPLWRLDV